MKIRALGKQISFRPVQPPAALNNPPLQCRSSDAIYPSTDDDFKGSCKRRLGQRSRSFLLGFNHKEVRRIIRGLGQNIEAIAAASRVRHSDGAPFTHADRCIPKANKRRKRSRNGLPSGERILETREN
jgi:hypothetical protein